MAQRFAVFVGTALLLLAVTPCAGLLPLLPAAAGAGPGVLGAPETAAGAAAPWSTGRPATGVAAGVPHEARHSLAADHQPSPQHLLAPLAPALPAPSELRRPRAAAAVVPDPPRPATPRHAPRTVVPLADPHLVRLTKDRGS